MLPRNQFSPGVGIAKKKQAGLPNRAGQRFSGTDLEKRANFDREVVPFWVSDGVVRDRRELVAQLGASAFLRSALHSGYVA